MARPQELVYYDDDYRCFRPTIKDKSALCLFIADHAQYDERYVWLLPGSSPGYTNSSIRIDDQRHYLLRAVIFDPFMEWILEEGEVWCVSKGHRIVVSFPFTSLTN